jgi:serine/threonine protein kinase
MAPEVVKQTGHTKKADIWSVGCLVVEMLTGEHPWAQLTQMQAIFKVRSSYFYTYKLNVDTAFIRLVLLPNLLFRLIFQPRHKTSCSARLRLTMRSVRELLRVFNTRGLRRSRRNPRRRIPRLPLTLSLRPSIVHNFFFFSSSVTLGFSERYPPSSVLFVCCLFYLKLSFYYY